MGRHRQRLEGCGYRYRDFWSLLLLNSMEGLCLQRGKNRPYWLLDTKSLLLPYQRLLFHSSYLPCKGWVPDQASEVGMKQVRCLWELPR